MNQDIEQRLIAGCKRGESWAMKEVYEKYASGMLSLCMRYVSDRELAKDVLQDGFVKVFTKVHQFEERGAFGGWIRQVFVNTSLEYLKRNESYKMNVSMEDFGNDMNEFDMGILQHISADDLMECITELPDKYRTVFNMHAIEGFSHNEIGKMLGFEEATSRSQFARARKMLQKTVLSLMKRE